MGPALAYVAGWHSSALTSPSDGEMMVIATVLTAAFSLREYLGRSAVLTDPEDQLIDLGDGFTMISCGWSNRTPWGSPREMDEDDLDRHIEKLASQVPDPARAVFNLHVPPAGTAIDQAPVLDSSLKPVVKGGAVLMESVGSRHLAGCADRAEPAKGHQELPAADRLAAAQPGGWRPVSSRCGRRAPTGTGWWDRASAAR